MGFRADTLHPRQHSMNGSVPLALDSEFRSSGPWLYGSALGMQRPRASETGSKTWKFPKTGDADIVP